MKIKTLKIEGNEKIKFKLYFEFDEVKIVLFQGGNATKYSDKLTFNKVFGEESRFEESIIGKTIRRLYGKYLKGKEVETLLIEKFEDMVYIEIKD